MTSHVWLQLKLPKDEPAALKRDFPDVEFHTGEMLSPETMAAIDVVFLNQMFDEELLGQMPKVRWIHGTPGGARGMLTPQVIQRSITVTSSRGAYATAMSEFAVACLLTLRKQILTCHDLQKAGKSKDIASLRPELLDGGVVGIVGLGGIGLAVAQKCKAFGMRVLATKLHVDERPACVDELYTPEHFPELARRADALVFCAPPTALTKGMMSAEVIDSLKPSCVIVNVVTRNAIMDEAAIVKSLKENRIAGAAFSVFGGATMPAPESELWKLPNAIVCPGVAAYDPNKWRIQRNVFTENLRRFMAGRTMLNLGDPNAGY